ncbi:MAG: dephospho-CoA kinase [Lawsonibacter sp.]|nr:dephospho-CoA kinase [Lawsonibacter sp.]
MIVIGITGPTGSGKTTALNELSALGGCSLDADAMYHQLLESSLALRSELESRFGFMTDETGRFDRKKLGAVVFQDPGALADLNAITHRYMEIEIRARLTRAEQEGYPAAAIDAIRLFESGAAELCDVTLAITAPPQTRIRRIMVREGISAEYARARVAAQQSDDFYKEACDYVLINNCANREEFGARARALFELILRRGKQ